MTRDCPKCSGRMADGFVTDNTYGSVGVASWVAGIPEKSIWTGLKLKGRAKIAITTRRCERCGFLESYANSR